MTVVLALDLAMHRTGWALGGTDWKRPQWGVFETEHFGKHTGRELLRFERLMTDIIEANPLTHIVYEKVIVDVRRPHKVDPRKPAFSYEGNEAMMMLSGAACMTAERHNIAIERILVDDWRRRFLGINRAPKDRGGKTTATDWFKDKAIKAAVARGWYVTHHDEAEALGILDYTLFCLDRGYAHRTDPQTRRLELEHDFKRGVFKE